MFGQKSQLLRLGVGGLGDFGPGIAGYKSWIVAFGIVLALAWLARWTISPARRAARARHRDGVHETDLAKPAAEPGGDHTTRAKKTRSS